jgi:hypothetical protein
MEAANASGSCQTAYPINGGGLGGTCVGTIYYHWNCQSDWLYHTWNVRTIQYGSAYNFRWFIACNSGNVDQWWYGS